MKSFLYTNLVFVINIVIAVPPEECLAPFRRDDCGMAPKPVMYYWKPGSRCEIGFWRGCLPNPNMFANEYDCSNTCIFKYRKENDEELEIPESKGPILEVNTTESVSNDTDVTVDGNATVDENSTGNEDVNGTGTTSVQLDGNGTAGIDDGGNSTEDTTGATGGDASAGDATGTTGEAESTGT